MDTLQHDLFLPAPALGGGSFVTQHQRRDDCAGVNYMHLPMEQNDTKNQPFHDVYAQQSGRDGSPAAEATSPSSSSASQHDYRVDDSCAPDASVTCLSNTVHANSPRVDLLALYLARQDSHETCALGLPTSEPNDTITSSLQVPPSYASPDGYRSPKALSICSSTEKGDHMMIEQFVQPPIEPAPSGPLPLLQIHENSLEVDMADDPIPSLPPRLRPEDYSKRSARNQIRRQLAEMGLNDLDDDRKRDYGYSKTVQSRKLKPIRMRRRRQLKSQRDS